MDKQTTLEYTAFLINLGHDAKTIALYTGLPAEAVQVYIDNPEILRWVFE
jgi:hypothetical protein